jgi:hypothetical protein
MSPVNVRSTPALLLLTAGSPLLPAAAGPSAPAVRSAPAAAASAPAAAATPADSIHWEGLEGALTASRQDGRPVLVYFTFDT